MTDVMIDLETLATTPRAAILSIGAVAFDRERPGVLGEEFYARIKFAQGDVSHDTLEWWMHHRTAWPKGEAVPLGEALMNFRAFLWRCQDGHCLWSHGASFDVPILHSAFLACGLDVPWGHRTIRDTRTLFDIAGYDFSAASHDALLDAKAQALAVQEAIQKLRRHQGE